jgi:hypothetical protein
VGKRLGKRSPNTMFYMYLRAPGRRKASLAIAYLAPCVLGNWKHEQEGACICELN